MRLPNFFIAGAAKAGTTSLWRYLLQHPDIFMPTDIMYKEPAFFSDIKGVKSLKEYTLLFSDATTEKMVGEASTAYLTSPESPVRIKEMISHAKIIIMLRNPIDRAYSLYNWMASNGYESSESFEMALQMEKRNRYDNESFKHTNPEYYYNYLYFHSGLYSKQIKRYIDNFKRDQLCFIIFEEFKANIKQEIKKAFAFLCVDDSIVPDFKIYNSGKTPYSTSLQFFIRQELYKYLRPPHNNAHPLCNKIIAKLMKLNTRPEKPHAMSESIRKKLKENYIQDVQKTGELIGKDLSHWWTEFQDELPLKSTPFHPRQHETITGQIEDKRSSLKSDSDPGVESNVSLLDLPISSKDLIGEGRQDLMSESLNCLLVNDKDSAVNTQTRLLDSKINVKFLKIVHLCSHDFGGAGKAAYRLHKGLMQIGLASTMFVANKNSGDPSVKGIPSEYNGEMMPSLNVPTYQSPMWPQQRRRWEIELQKYPNRPCGLELFTDTSSVINLEQIQEIKDADIINLHWVAGILDYPSAPLALKDKHLVWTLHDMNPFTGGCHYSGKCERYKERCGACPQLGSTSDNDLSRQIWNLKNDTFQHLDVKIVAPSKWLAECASKSSLMSRYSVKVIPNGFPLDVFKPYNKTEIRKSLKVSSSAKVILFGAASLDNERKGFKYLLEALHNFSCQNDHDIILLTFGQFPAGLENPLKFPIYNLGVVSSEEQLALAYSAADVFVIPSLEDNLPNTVIEAMSCGVPVVGFNVGGIPDMVEHGKNGFLAKPQSTRSLAEGIEWVLSSPERHSQLSKHCREKVERQYDLSTQAQAYKQLYETLRPTAMNETHYAEELIKMGEDLFYKGMLDEAKRKFGEALAIDKDNSIIHNNLAVVHQKQNNMEMAEIHYLKATELDPANIDFKKNCAEFYISELGRVEDALRMYTAILEANSKDVETLLIIGHICAALENPKEAAEFYQQALQIEPSNKHARESLYRLSSSNMEVSDVTSNAQQQQDLV